MKIQKWLNGLSALALCFALTGCDVEQTSEGRLPDVDVDADPGAMPSYDVDTPEVDVTTEEKKMTVPDVDVDTKETTVDVPDVDVTLPEDN